MPGEMGALRIDRDMKIKKKLNEGIRIVTMNSKMRSKNNEIFQL